MPIINLTDKPDEAQLPRIAKMHKGDKKGPNGQMGADLDYFRVEFEPPYAQYKEAWEELYGEKPDSFERVFVTHATVQDAFDTWKEDWNASQTLLHRCDGENQVLWYNQSAQMYSTAKIACATKPDKPCACKHVGRFDLLIPEFVALVGIVGFVTVETHSINDIMTVFGVLANTQRQNGGSLLGVPFTLGRADDKISAPNKKAGTRIKVEKSLFYLYPDPDYTREVLLPRMAQMGMLAANQPQLPPPQPLLSLEDAKGLLGSGAGTRRMGDDPKPETTPAEQSPVAAQSTPEPVVTPPVVAAPPATPSGEQSIAGIETVKSALGKLKNRAMTELFGKDRDGIKAMNECVGKLIKDGKLPDAMSIDEAFQIIKSANCPQSSASSADANETVVEASAPTAKDFSWFDGKKATLHTVERINLADEKGKFSWRAWFMYTDDTGNDRDEELTLSPDDVAAIIAKNHIYPEAGKSEVYVVVRLMLKDGKLAINRDTLEVRDTTPVSDAITSDMLADKSSQEAFNALPNKYAEPVQPDLFSEPVDGDKSAQLTNQFA